MTSTKQQQDEWARSVEEFLQQGGQVDQIPQGKSGYVEGQSRSAWGAPRKRTVVAEPVVAKAPQKRAKK
jgi:hypothetical protein